MGKNLKYNIEKGNKTYGISIVENSRHGQVRAEQEFIQRKMAIYDNDGNGYLDEGELSKLMTDLNDGTSRHSATFTHVD